MPLEFLPEVIVTPVFSKESGGWIIHSEQALPIRAAVRPVSRDVVDCYRLEPENRPPLPGPVLITREAAEQIIYFDCSYVHLASEELGALDGFLFRSRGFQIDPTWAAWNLEVWLDPDQLLSQSPFRNGRREGDPVLLAN